MALMGTPPNVQVASLSQPREVPVVQPDYSFEGNDSVTVLDVYLPGVKRSDITLRVTGKYLVVVGNYFTRGKYPLRPSLKYVLTVQLSSPVDRNAVNATKRGLDTLTIRIPAVST